MMYLIFDCETCGLPVNQSADYTNTTVWPRLVSIAWILVDHNKKVHAVDKRIVKPDGWTIPKEAVDVHGITTEFATLNGEPIADIITAFTAVWKKADILVGHNVRFDKRIVAAEMHRLLPTLDLCHSFYETTSYDTMHASREFVQAKFPQVKNGKRRNGFKNPTLTELHEKLYNEKFEDAHDAGIDARITLKCFFGLLKLGLIQRYYQK